MSKDTFCVLPWVQIATNASGFLRVCCNSTPGKNLIKKPDGTPYKIYEDDMDEAWNSEVYTKIRSQMINGERPEMCAKCFKEEDVGIRSSRIFWNERWKTDEQYGETAKLNIKYLDVRLGNLCNLKCRMCNPYASDQWVEEWPLVNPDADKKELFRLSQLNWMDEPKAWENLNMLADSVDEIYFTGGEPTVIKEQHRLLDYCIELGIAKNIILKYNTNLTNIPKHLLDKWSQFKLVRVNCSVDAIGELDRYIRYPSDWATIEKNFHRIRAVSNVRVEIHCTVQMYNILRLTDMIEWCKSNNVRLFLNVLDRPEYLNIRVLPEHLKEEVALRLSRYTEERIQGVVDYMMAEDWSNKYDEFIQFTKRIDESRGQNISKLIPEFSYE